MSTAARPTRVAAYCRVSTHEQHADIQVEAIQKAANERGWKLVSEYVDAGVSGGRDRRPALDALLEQGIQSPGSVRSRTSAG